MKKRIIDTIANMPKEKRRVYVIPYPGHITPSIAKKNFFEALDQIYLQIYERDATTIKHITPGAIIPSDATIETKGTGEGYIHTLSKTNIPAVTPGMDLVVSGEHYMISRVEGIDADSCTIVTHRKADFAASTACTVEAPDYFTESSDYTVVSFDLTPFYGGNRGLTTTDDKLPARQSNYLEKYGNSWSKRLRISFFEDDDEVDFNDDDNITKSDYIVNYLGGCVIVRGDKSDSKFKFDIDGHCALLAAPPEIKTSISTSSESYKATGIDTPVLTVVNVDAEEKSGSFKFYYSVAQYFAHVIVDDYDSKWLIGHDFLFDPINDTWRYFYGDDWDNTVDPDSSIITNEIKASESPFGFAVIGFVERPKLFDGTEKEDTKDFLWTGIFGYSCKLDGDIDPMAEEGLYLSVSFKAEQNVIYKTLLNKKTRA